jgi:prevent-host-death family protein
VAEIKVSDDIVPMADFKAHMSRYFRELGAEQRPLVVTQNGRPAAVVLSPKAFDELRYSQRYRDAVDEGVRSSGEGKSVSNERMLAWLESWGTEAELAPPSAE